MPSNAADTRHRILLAFAAQYDESGPPDVERVAEAAGVSRSTVYRHFTDAAGILEAARQDGMAAGTRLIERHLAAVLRGDTGADLIAAAGALMTEVLRDGIPYAVLLRHDAAGDAAITERFAPFAIEIIRRGQRDGTVDPALDPRAMLTAAVSICRVLIAETASGSLDPESASLVVQRFFDAFRPR